MLEKLKNVFSTFVKKTLTEKKLDEAINDLRILLISNDVAIDTADELCKNISESFEGEQITRFTSTKKMLFETLKKIIIEAKVFLDQIDPYYKIDQKHYINFLEKLFKLLEKTKMIQSVFPYLEDYQSGNRDIYHKIFKPDIIPNFTFTRLISDLPQDAEIVDQYKIAHESYDESLVTILRRKDESKLIYLGILLFSWSDTGGSSVW